MRKYFIFNKNIILVNGANRGLIQDLNRKKIFSIDHFSKIYLKKLLNGYEIEKLISEISKDDSEKFIRYLDLLINNDIGYYSDKWINSGEYEKQKKIDQKIETVWFELRKACNLHCCHCYLDSNINSDKNLEMLSINEWKMLIDQLEKYNPKKIILIGGEPLLFRELSELIIYCKQKCKDTDIVLYSNLTLLDENTLRCIKKNNIKVITSLYSSIPSIHDKITGVNGSFKLTVKNIKKLIENKCFVQANTVIMNYNHENIDDTIRYIHRLTNKKGKVDVIRNIGNSKEGFASREICETYERIRAKPDFNPISEKIFFRNYSGNSCWQGKINISCDGYVTPCIMAGKFANKAFNIKELSVNEILENYLKPKFWSISKDYVDECKDCEYRYVCKDCRPMNEENKNILSKGRNCMYNPYKGKWNRDVKGGK